MLYICIVSWGWFENIENKFRESKKMEKFENEEENNPFIMYCEYCGEAITLKNPYVKDGKNYHYNCYLMENDLSDNCLVIDAN